jgi:tetratricopeptide (TPR) repeat protein
MMPAVRGVAMAAVVLLATFAGWRVIGIMQAERYAAADPQRALGWRGGDPQALLADGLRRLELDDPAGAAASARALLAREPLEGRAFRVLGEAEDRLGRAEMASKLYAIAADRAPRDIPARAWLAQHFLDRRDFPRALAQIDFVLRTTPERTRGINRILKNIAPLVQDEAFADALTNVLLTNPPWRSQMLKLVGGFPDANSRILQDLRKRGGLSQDEYATWLDGLMAQGRWGEAYARWASHAVATGGRLPLLYNGDFLHEPSNVGFDWRIKSVPGVLLEFSSRTGEQDGTAQLTFLNQSFPDAGLRHPLLLYPGSYRLDMKVRGQALHSGLALRWRLECLGKAGLLADGEPLDGSFGWRESSMAFTVPPERCPGQMLRLANPSEKGVAQRVEGTLWVDDVAIHQVTGP